MKILSVLLFFVPSVVFAQKIPKVSKTAFSKEALSQKITSQDGKKISVSEIMRKHEGKILIIDFWASWCRDCILALPSAKELKEQNPAIAFVYFSLDRSYEQWKRGLDKYEISGNENYWFDEGWKNNFNNYIDLNWVPRFIVVDQKGAITNYYSIHPNDPQMLQIIEKLKR